jgi:hypothetical protein
MGSTGEAVHDRGSKTGTVAVGGLIAALSIVDAHIFELRPWSWR